jgi:hypothetical protein
MRTWRPGRRSPLPTDVRRPVMSLDNGVTYGEPDTHPLRLRCIERVEQLAHALRIKTDAGVLDGDAYAVIGVPCGCDQQSASTVANDPHRIRGVARQIQHHLLELNAIAGNHRKIISELRNAGSRHGNPIQVALHALAREGVCISSPAGHHIR